MLATRPRCADLNEEESSNACRRPDGRMPTSCTLTQVRNALQQHRALRLEEECWSLRALDQMNSRILTRRLRAAAAAIRSLRHPEKPGVRIGGENTAGTRLPGGETRTYARPEGATRESQRLRPPLLWEGACGTYSTTTEGVSRRVCQSRCRRAIACPFPTPRPTARAAPSTVARGSPARSGARPDRQSAAQRVG